MAQPSDEFLSGRLFFDLRDLHSEVQPCRGVYCIRNKRSRNIYIGSAANVRRRLIAHLSQLRRGIHHSLRMQWAWATNGESVLEVSLIEIVADDVDLLAMESRLVALLQPEYNFSECVDNPMRGRRHSAEAIAKMSANRLGKGCGPRVFSEAHCAALKAAARPGPNLNRRGEKRPRKTCLKMSAAVRAQFAKGRVSGRTRPVAIDGVVYPSGKDAAAALGVSQTNIIYKIKRGRGQYLPAA